MEINIVLFLNLLLYAVIASQSFMYMIALSNVQKNLDAAGYIQLRHLLDRNFRRNNSAVVYMSLVTSTLFSLLCSAEPGSLLFISSLIAWILLIVDVVLTLKGSMPLNNIINEWSADNYPQNWSSYRAEWLDIFRKRQIAITCGFISLLAGVAFG